MGRTKRMLGMLLALCLLLGLCPALPAGAADAGPMVIYDMETFKRLMTEDGDVSIRLGANLFEQHGWVRSEVPGGELPLALKICMPWLLGIDHKSPSYYDPSGERVRMIQSTGHPSYERPYWLTFGRGNKTVDLAGHEIRVEYPNVFQRESTMFLVGSGSSVTIGDSSGTAGYIHYDGYIFDVEDYSVGTYDYAAEMQRHIFAVNGGSLTINGGTIEAGRSKTQWITNAHPYERNGLVAHDMNQYKSYTGNVTKSVRGNAINLVSGTVKINGGVLLGRGEGNAVAKATGGRMDVVEANLNARGGADCVFIGENADVEIWSGAFCLHRNGIVYEGRDPHIEGYPYGFHYGYAGRLGFDRDDMDYANRTLLFMDPRPPRHWMIPNSIVEGDAFDLWNEIVVPYGYETFMLVMPTASTAEFIFDAAPYTFHHILKRYERQGRTEYVPVFGEAARARGTDVRLNFYYDVYNFETMELIGSCSQPGVSDLDLSQAIPGLNDRLRDAESYIVFCTVLENYEGAYPYEVRSVCCNEFTITSDSPIRIESQPQPQMAPAKGETVTLTAKAENATGAYWEVTSEYNRRVETTGFASGVATLTVPVEWEASYRCVFTNSTYTERTNSASVTYCPSFDVRPGETRTSVAVLGEDKLIVLWQDSGDEDYYGQANLYAWYKDGAHVNAADPHYEKAAYWGGGIGLKIKNVTQADAGRYTVVCIDEDTPFRSGAVELVIADVRLPVMDMCLTGFGTLHAGDPAPTKEDIETNDVRVAVKDLTWANLDAAGRLTEDSWYTITMETRYGAVFDIELTWSMDANGFDYGTVSADKQTAVLIDKARYQEEFKYREEDDRVIPERTAFTLYQGSYVPMTGQLRGYTLACPAPHGEAFGYAHAVGSVTVADPSAVPEGLTVTPEGFCGVVTAEPGTYPVTLRYSVVDSATGVKHNDWDVTVTFTVLPADGEDPDPYAHVHDYGSWTSDGALTHSAVCEDCGERMALPHIWDEGTVALYPRLDADGLVLYTCTICGAVYTEPLTYEDYLPPFPEVSELSYEDGTVTVSLYEYSGDAEGVRLLIAAYDGGGALLRVVFAQADKTGRIEAELGPGAKRISVFVVDETGLEPLSRKYTKVFP